MNYLRLCFYEVYFPRSCASSSPVIVEPEVQGGIEIDNTRGFLILMSDGLYKSLEDATGTDHVNADIASMVATEFSQQSTLNGVAQAVVDKVVRKHHDAFMMSPCKTVCRKRDDITLLVRNISYQLANMNSPQSSPNLPVSQNALSPLSVIIPGGHSTHRSVSGPQLQLAATRLPPTPQFNIHTNTKTVRSHSATNTGTLSSTLYATNDSSDSTPSSEEHSKSQSGRYMLSLDEHGRIEAYVDFAPFYDAMEKLSDKERTELEAEMEPKPDFETIVEEKEPDSEPSTPDVESINFTAL